MGPPYHASVGGAAAATAATFVGSGGRSDTPLLPRGAVREDRDVVLEVTGVQDERLHCQ